MKYILLLLFVSCGFNYSIQQEHVTHLIYVEDASLYKIYDASNKWMLNMFDEEEIEYNVLKGRVYILGKNDSFTFIQIQAWDEKVILTIVPPDNAVMVYDDFKLNVVEPLNL